MKFGDLGEKSMQILNIQVNLLSEQPLTMNRQKVTEQGKMCGFSRTRVENSAFAIFPRYQSFLAETGNTRLQLQFQQF